MLSHKPFGRVFLAQDPSGRRVVIKELSFHLAPDARVLDAFERETALLASLDDPRLPKVLGCFAEGTGAHLRLYQVQSLVEGRSLAAIASEGPLGDGAVRDIGQQLFRILSVLHGHQPPVIHRDIKPANLIWRPDGTLALVDFGAARQLVRDHTHGATLVGTFGYMAPEQLGGTVSPASDLYAAGATLLELITGSAPAQLVSPDGIELEWRPHVDRTWRPILERLLARSPRDRFPSAAAALNALRTAPEDRRRRRALRLIALVAFGSAIGGPVVRALWQHLHAPAAPKPAVSQLGSPASTGNLAAAFRQLASAQAESAKMSALYQLLYSDSKAQFPADAAQRLSPLLKDPIPSVREKVVSVLSLERIPALDALPVLLEAAAHDASVEVRERALIAAGEQFKNAPQDARTAALADRLVDIMFTDPDAEVRALASQPLSEVHPLSAVALERIRRGLVEGPVNLRNPMMGALIAHALDLHMGEAEALSLMRSGNAYQRRLGIVGLSVLPPSARGMEALADAILTDEEPMAREDAARVLRGFGASARPAIDRLGAALGEGSEAARLRALDALKILGEYAQPWKVAMAQAEQAANGGSGGGR